MAETRDPVGESISELRCTSVADGHRCQMWRTHQRQGIAEHAASWAEPVPIGFYRGGRGRVAPRHWWRWNDAGVVREQAPGSERLPWCALGIN